MTLRPVAAGIENATRSGEFIQLAAHLVSRRGLGFAEMEAAEARLSPRTRQILKTAVTAGSTGGNWAATADYDSLARSFLESLRGLSVFDTAMANGMRLVPLRSRIAVVSTAVVGSTPSELSVKPISSLSLTPFDVAERKAVAIVVANREVFKLSGAASNLFGNELRNGVAVATDTDFLATLLAATTPTASSGSSTANTLTDFSALLSALTIGANSKIIVVMSPANLIKLMLKVSSGSGVAYPLLKPTGGQLFNDISVVPSVAIASSAVLAFDATALAGNSERIELRTATHADVMLQTAPDSPETSGTVLRSLWQNNETALAAERWYGFSVVRAGAIF